MRSRVTGTCLLAACLFVFGMRVTVSAQGAAIAAQGAAAQAGEVRRLTVEESVRLALENNLGIRSARLAPQLEDLNVASARTAWAPALTSTLQQGSSEAPNSSFLSGGGTSTTNSRLLTNVSLQQPLPWGGRYSIGWDSTRSTTNNIFSNFSPTLQSSVSLHVTQPLLRSFSIDASRQQLLTSQKNREIADVQLRQTVTSLTRSVRNAYWELAYAIASLETSQQSLDLAQESLRNTRSRVEIGTIAPIDVITAEAEVARREEAIIVAQAQIASAEDTLRTLVFDPKMPEFWTARIEPAEAPPFREAAIDIDTAIRNALERRTDLDQTRKTLEAADIDVRFYRNQTLPDITASLDYGLSGLGGTQFQRGPGFPGEIIGQSQRSFASVLGDVFGNQFPNWTAAVNISYPLGHTRDQVSLASSRLRMQQSQTQLQEQQLRVVAQVRNAARQLQTNQKRVDTTRVARELAERQLQAEQRKLAAGSSTNYNVFLAQRDLAQARNSELRAILDYQRSVVDFDTVQEVPLGVATQ